MWMPLKVVEEGDWNWVFDQNNTWEHEVLATLQKEVFSLVHHLPQQQNWGQFLWGRMILLLPVEGGGH